VRGKDDIALCTFGVPAPPGRHVVLVPGADVPVLRLDLPARLRGPAREDVARRQLRDSIGAAGDHVEMRPFFAPGTKEGWCRALVADAAQLRDWRAQTGTGCRAVLPDYLALPAAQGLWVLAVENDSVQARLGLEDGFSADPDLARVMLARALEDDAAEPPKAVLMLGDGAGIATLLQAHGIPVVQNATEIDALGLGLARPEALAHGELSFDLRADPRAARDRLQARVLPWRWPLLFGLVAAALWAAAQTVSTRALEAEIRDERVETLALVRENFVPTGPVLDVRAQVSRSLVARQDAARDWQGQVSPLTVFGQVARVLATSQAVSRDFTFEAETLTAVLQLPDFAAAEALVADLRDAGLRVDVADLRVSDGASGVRAELRIRAAP
jgi:general secretion pathway protein L